MPWTPPSNLNVGDVVKKTDWDALVDDIIYLYAGYQKTISMDIFSVARQDGPVSTDLQHGSTDSTRRDFLLWFPNPPFSPSDWQVRMYFIGAVSVASRTAGTRLYLTSNINIRIEAEATFSSANTWTLVDTGWLGFPSGFNSADPTLFRFEGYRVVNTDFTLYIRTARLLLRRV
jgi:hypothetical protein